MAQVTYAEVVRLAEQLTRAEQQALIAQIGDFSNRREDWYGDDGR